MSFIEEKVIEHTELVSQLNLFDDDFSTVSFNDRKCLEFILSIILNKNIILKDHCSQFVIKILKKRSIQLDIYEIDENNVYYNVEIQKSKKGADPKRARYHLSLIDGNIAVIGEDWDKINDVYSIFIVEKDIFQQGKPIYFFDRKDDIPLKDGSHIIYVNGENREDTPL